MLLIKKGADGAQLFPIMAAEVAGGFYRVGDQRQEEGRAASIVRAP